MGDVHKQYDLENRVGIFGEKVIKFCKSIPNSTINRPLINQFVKSATSIGANYMEANCASSRRDFGNKIAICAKEARETEYWVRMFNVAVGRSKELDELAQESHELTLIFHKISGSLNNKYGLENKN